MRGALTRNDTARAMLVAAAAAKQWSVDQSACKQITAIRCPLGQTESSSGDNPP
jgi:hypothetical protein